MVCYILVFVIEDLNFECSACSESGVGVRGQGFLWWEPQVKLCQPVLKRVYLYKGQRFQVNLIKVCLGKEGSN